MSFEAQAKGVQLLTPEQKQALDEELLSLIDVQKELKTQQTQLNAHQTWWHEHDKVCETLVTVNAQLNQAKAEKRPLSRRFSVLSKVNLPKN
ncbi:hypothetical protein P4S72_25955 [Vibrio sp. PP-XX7]